MNTRKEAKEFEKRVALTRKVLRLEANTGLASLVSFWQATNKPRAPKSVDKMHLAVRYFIEAVRDMAPKDVTADHVGAFRDALERRQGMSSKTALKHLQGLNTLFNVAVSERKFGVATNPCAKITVRKSGGKLVDLDSKKPFQPAQIRTIFETMSSESEEFQWMVRLLTYHGCRTSEAAQLRVDDVTESFGIKILRMHDAHGRLKNRPSVREVPLHSACSDFVAYARSRKDHACSLGRFGRAVTLVPSSRNSTARS
jgi:integrase